MKLEIKAIFELGMTHICKAVKWPNKITEATPWLLFLTGKLCQKVCDENYFSNCINVILAYH